MISSMLVMFKRMRRWVSRSDWAIRLLRLSRLKGMADRPGLIMVQIDGLSLTQMQRALTKGQMPFLNSLMQKDRYVLHSFYSGLPSNTPAVQAELFYGVKSFVPAFCFMDRKSGEVIKMLNPAQVAAREAVLKTQGKGLLEGGSSYSNIYTGGAAEAHFCWAQMGWSGFLHAINPLVFPFLVFLYLDIFIRTFLLLVIEFFIAVIECIRGTLKGRLFLRELELVWLRVMVCVFLREMVVAGVCMDIIRGLPIIHFNLLGYDEQAHCRGPGSRFAHWSLKGIDATIKHIDHVIKQSPHRGYDLWIYSDHGQEKTDPYFVKYGYTVEEAIKKIAEPEAMEAVVTAIGPVGHVYLKKEIHKERMLDFGRKLVEEAGIPLVLMPQGPHKVLAWTPQGRFMLPEDAPDIFGHDHPFLEEVREDIMNVCHHPDAGDFIIMGWSKGAAAMSFPLEYGAHAGAGPEETKAFALLPMDIYIKPNGKNYLRPMDLREAAQNFMSQDEFFRPSFIETPALAGKTLCIMSYNVHGCKGMDGFISTDRIARVIARYNPDIVALQELDVGRTRSASIDQAERIARRLEMSFHFHPAFRHKDGEYGNAILSRYPMSLMKKAALPKLWNKRFVESRGALWVAVEYEGMKINIINTHLSLWAAERLVQVKSLLSTDWLQHPDCQGPVVLCGDLNMDPGSPVYKEICKSMHDSQVMLMGHHPTQTWFAGYPFRRIDHIFVTPEFQVHSIRVLHTALDKMASDHLPLIAELGFEGAMSVQPRR